MKKEGLTLALDFNMDIVRFIGMLCEWLRKERGTTIGGKSINGDTSSTYWVGTIEIMGLCEAFVWMDEVTIGRITSMY